jgi:hypothetical protein
LMWSLASKRLKRTSSSEDFQRSAKRSFSTQSEVDRKWLAGAQIDAITRFARRLEI